MHRLLSEKLLLFEENTKQRTENREQKTENRFSSNVLKRSEVKLGRRTATSILALAKNTAQLLCNVQL